MIERPEERARKPLWSVRMELCKYLNKMGIHNWDFLFLFSPSKYLTALYQNSV